MFYDLNVPWAARDPNLPCTLAFLQELGYDVVALNHTISGKLPADLSCPIVPPAPSSLPPKLQLKRRVTLVLSTSDSQPPNARLAELARNYDLLAVRPVDERGLQLACSSLDCDIISLDLSRRLPFWLRHKTLGEAVRAGKKFEICYAQALSGAGAADGAGMARRNLISGAMQLVRATRGRGVVISSEARSAVTCRGPSDVVNLGTVWGLGQERGLEAVGKEARSCVVSAEMKRTSYRGVVDVIYGGEKPKTAERENGKLRPDGSGQKRKAGSTVDDERGTANDQANGAPMSKRQRKRQEKEAKAKSIAAIGDFAQTPTDSDAANKSRDLN